VCKEASAVNIYLTHSTCFNEETITASWNVWGAAVQQTCVPCTDQLSSTRKYKFIIIKKGK
jgi:hypothetical protein